MKKFVVLSFIFLFTIQAVCADTKQPGKVLEYNRKAKKTPLSGVTLDIKHAGSTVSDKNGDFVLQFLTLKPGEKVNYRNINKKGFEIFNKDALEQWNLNPNSTFIVIMCKSDDFKKLCDTYYANSSKNYKQQYEKEQRELARLKKENKLKEAEYENKLREAQDRFERQLDNLDNYIDRFARIDLSELSLAEQEIIELIEQGRFEEAIEKYESQNLVEKYQEEVDNIKNISQAIDALDELRSTSEGNRDELQSSIFRHVDALLLAGGGENIDKARKILSDAYSVDTLNLQILRRYADYLYDQKDFNGAYPLFEKLVEASDGIDQTLHSLNRIVLILTAQDDYEAALEKFDILQSLIEGNREALSPDIVISYLANKGVIYQRGHNLKEAKDLYEGILTRDEIKECSPLTLASIKNRICTILDLEHHYEESIPQLEEILALYRANNDNSNESNERLAGILLNIAQNYNLLLNGNKADEYIRESLAFAEKCYESNPDRYFQVYTLALNTAGNIFLDQKKFDEAEKYYNLCFEVIKPQYDAYPEINWRDFLNANGNLAILYTSLEQYDKAIEAFEKNMAVIRQAPESLYRSKSLSENLYNLSYIYCVTEDFQKGSDLLYESLIYSKKLFDYNPRYGAKLYLNELSNLAYCLDGLDQQDKAKQIYLDGINTIENLELTEVMPFILNYAQFNYNLGEHLHNKDNSFEEAVKYYEKAFNIYDSLQLDEENVEVVTGLALAFLSMNDLESASHWIDRIENPDIVNTNLTWLSTRGNIAYQKGDLTTARKCRDLILELKPDVDRGSYTIFTLPDME